MHAANKTGRLASVAAWAVLLPGCTQMLGIHELQHVDSGDDETSDAGWDEDADGDPDGRDADDVDAPSGCEACTSTQGCLEGTCVERSCEPKALFCGASAVRKCDDEGLGSTEVEHCDPGEFCDAKSGICKIGVCAAGQRTCDQNFSRLCNGEGTGFVPDGVVDCTDKGMTCTSGTCQGACAPDQTQCSGNGLQTCNESGQYGMAKPCEDEGKTCLGAPRTASCQGVCAPGQVQCSGNRVQSCDPLTGQYGAVTACKSATPHCSDGSCGQPSSCQGLTLNCGDSSNDSCCTSVKVTGGQYKRINNENYSATVADFRLDAFEVTVGRWRKFVAAWNKGWRPAVGAGKHGHLNGGKGLTSSYNDGDYETGWEGPWASNVDTLDTARSPGETFATWTANSGANENRPINYVNWYESYAFCIWDGGFLPSEAEWNYAAAGGSMQREYPWGGTIPTCAQANFFGGSGATTYCYPDTYTWDVGTLLGNGIYGQGDLAGNVSEWTLDWSETTTTAFLAPCDNCAYVLSSASDRVIRGGAFNAAASALTTWRRSSASHTSRSASVGLRCARAP